MISIDEALKNILDAVYGEEVRTSIHDAIYIMGRISEVKFGTDVSSGSSPTEGYQLGEVYVNTSTFDMFKYELTGWVKKGNLIGNGITSIEKIATVGLVDTYRVGFTKSAPFEFEVTNGNGIEKIELTGSVGKRDTYTITFDGGGTEQFTVTNANEVYVKYSANADGTGYTGEPQEGSKYIGVAVAETEPTDKAAYRWALFKGVDSHVFVKYSANADGTDFVDTPSYNRKYIGVYSGQLEESPADKAAYTWSKYVGENGTGSGDMLEADYVDAGGTGVVLKAQGLEGADNTALKKIGEDTEGKITYGGEAIGNDVGLSIVDGKICITYEEVE